MLHRLQAHLDDPDSLGIAIGRVTSSATGGFYVILHHRKDHRHGRGPTLESAISDCFPTTVVEIDLGDL